MLSFLSLSQVAVAITETAPGNRTGARAGGRAFGRARAIRTREILSRQPGLPREKAPRSRAEYHLQVHVLER